MSVRQPGGPRREEMSNVRRFKAALSPECST